MASGPWYPVGGDGENIDMEPTIKSEPPARERYVPALGFRWLTSFYDPLAALWLPEDDMRRDLVEQAGLRPGQRVLDIGCGTGTLLGLVIERCPAALAWGIDGDRAMLARARAKLTGAPGHVGLIRGLASDLPFPPASFDRVLTSLVLHHLTTRTKARTLAAAHALLRPGGELHVADWGDPQDLPMWLAFQGVRLLDGRETTDDNYYGRLPGFMRDAGFTDVRETGRRRTVFGPLVLWSARRPEA